MGIEYNDGSVWKNVYQPHINVGGTWKQAKTVYQKVNGVWETVWPGGPALTADTWYDNDTASWPIAKLNTPRFGAGAAVYGGKIYIVGGRDNSGSELDSIEVFDPALNTCTTLSTTMPEARHYGGCEIIDGKLYVLKGITSGGGYTKDVLIYDIDADSWTTGLEDSPALGKFNSVAVDGKIYCLPGDPGSSDVGYFDRYNPDIDTWTSLANYVDNSNNSAYHGPAGAYHSGYIYGVGGNYYHPGIDENDMYRYNIGSNNWSQVSNAPVDIERHNFDTVGNKIYMAFGLSGSSNYNEVYEYDTGTDNWNTNLSLAPEKYWLRASVALNGIIYYIGGKNNVGTPFTTDYITAYVTPQGGYRPY